MQKKYIIGIDTGGTYTDAVLFDTIKEQITAAVKSPTTHYDLSVGITEALEKLLHQSQLSPEQVQTIAVSSTLATNSVVENKGARVAVIVIGYVKHFKLPVKAVVYVDGGHTVKGAEETPLDLDYLIQLLHGLKSEVDGYAVCSAMSIKNPTHELVVEKAIGMIDPKPVFCSHRISDLTGMQERAATAGLHAKLMPIMIDFMGGVNRGLDKLRLDCPVVVIGGNGAALEAGRVETEAGLTVASGPACSAKFGAEQNREACLVVDIGGTTTDIAMIQAGSPVLSSQGCQIGQWKTHVEAIDMHTAGIGGDSHVTVDKQGKITVGPARVTPLSMTKDTRPIDEWLGSSDQSKLICCYPEVKDQLLDNEVTALLKEFGQVTSHFIRQQTGLSGVPLQRQLEQLSSRQQIFECGFTPTDALHVLGQTTLGDADRAIAAAQILGKEIHLSATEFAHLVITQTEDHIENLILEYITQHYWDTSLGRFIETRKNHPVLGVDFFLKLPLIGIGASARYFLPEIAKRLQTTVEFPENCEVGNAIGAAVIGYQNIQQPS